MAKVIYQRKDGRSTKTFDALDKKSSNTWACGLSNANQLRELIRRRRTEAFIIYDQSSAPSADDYIIDVDYPIETYL